MRTFKEAVLQLPEIAACYCEGLDALPSKDRSRIKANNTRLIQGSVDMDRCKGIAHRPHEKRWDYIVAYDGLVFAIEVHPAGGKTANNEVIEKAKWMIRWEERQNQIKIERPFIYISSGKTLPNLNGSLAQRGFIEVTSVGRFFNFDDYLNLRKKFQSYQNKA